MADDAPSLAKIEEALARIHLLASEALGVSPEALDPDAPLAELGVDSLDWAEVVLDVEQAFELRISDADAARLGTLREVARYVAAGGRFTGDEVMTARTAPTTTPMHTSPPTDAHRAEKSTANVPFRPIRHEDADASRIVITGFGVVSPLGCDARAMQEALLAGESGITAYQGELPNDFKVRIAAHARGFDAESVLGPRGARRFGRFALMAVSAARSAAQSSGISGAGYAPERVGVVLGVGMGGVEVLEEASTVLHAKGARFVPARGIIGLIPNMAAGLVAQELGAHGRCYTTASACASSGHAIGEALHALRAGHADAMITGGSEGCLTPLAIACFAQIGALSRRNDDPAHASRPFDRDRDGFVIGEGAGVLVLERYDAARRRGAHIHAELGGYGASADAHHPVEPDPEGRGAVLAMSAALHDARENPEAVQYVNAHGTSTPYNDRVETRALKRAFGEHAKKLWVSSSKSMTGHLLGAAGAIEAIVCAQVVEQGRVPPTINLQTPDPACDLDYVPNHAREAKVRVAISNSFAFGGQNACLVLRAV